MPDHTRTFYTTRVLDNNITTNTAAVAIAVATGVVVAAAAVLSLPPPRPSPRRNRDSFVMGTLARSVLAGRPSAFGCSAGAFLRSRPCLLSHSKLDNVYPLQLVSHRASTPRSSPPSSLSAELGVDPENRETQIQSSEMNTVRVLFQLQKVCVFGQHFFLVGDDPVLGLWDPEHAIPLIWSDGHLWSAEMSLPVGKTILFKFILKGSRGEVSWQPGLDRILTTWKTINIIVVSEDWDNAELQKINEVLLEQTRNMTTGPSLLTENEVDVTETEEVISSEEDETSIIINEHQPVLVPGLISSSSSSVEDVEGIKFVPPITSDEAIEGIILKEEEELLDESEKSIDPLHIVKPDEDNGESTVNMASESSEGGQTTEEAPVTDDVFENDIQWGRKSLLQFILNLGFQNNQPS